MSKLTKEEKRICVQFAAFMSNCFGLPYSQGVADTCVAIVEDFETQFNANADLMRGMKSAAAFEELARRNGLTDHLEAQTWQPVQSCELIDKPHDHAACKRSHA